MTTDETLYGLPDETELVRILDDLLEKDEDITVRAVARLHSTIHHASSFVRSKHRMEIIRGYQEKQVQYRSWRQRSKKASSKSLTANISEKDLRIAELERQVDTLIASHVALIRVVGELGGIPKWLKLFEGYGKFIETLSELNAISAADIKETDKEKKRRRPLTKLVPL